MLIEPTETEPIETLDAFVEALIAIAGEARTDPGHGEGGAADGARPPAGRGQCGAEPEPSLAPLGGCSPTLRTAAPQPARRAEIVPGLPVRAVQHATFVRNTDRGGSVDEPAPEFYRDRLTMKPSCRRARALCRPQR